MLVVLKEFSSIIFDRENRANWYFLEGHFHVESTTRGNHMNIVDIGIAKNRYWHCKTN